MIILLLMRHYEEEFQSLGILKQPNCGNGVIDTVYLSSSTFFFMSSDFHHSIPSICQDLIVLSRQCFEIRKSVTCFLWDGEFAICIFQCNYSVSVVRVLANAAEEGNRGR